MDTTTQHLLLGMVVAALQSIQLLLHEHHSQEIQELRAQLAICHSDILALRAANRQD